MIEIVGVTATLGIVIAARPGDACMDRFQAMQQTKLDPALRECGVRAWFP